MSFGGESAMTTGTKLLLQLAWVGMPARADGARYGAPRTCEAHVCAAGTASGSAADDTAHAEKHAFEVLTVELYR